MATMGQPGDLQALSLAIQQIGVNVLAMQKKLDETSRAVEELRSAFLHAGKLSSFQPNSYGRQIFMQLIRLEAELSVVRTQVALNASTIKLPHRS